MVGRRAQHLGEVLAVGVNGARDKRRLGAQRKRHWVEGVVDRSLRRGLGDLALLGGGGVLALGQSVDPVVEQQNLEVDVATQCMHEVIATDAERIAVAGDDPN